MQRHLSAACVHIATVELSGCISCFQSTVPDMGTMQAWDLAAAAPNQSCIVLHSRVARAPGWMRSMRRTSPCLHGIDLASKALDAPRQASGVIAC